MALPTLTTVLSEKSYSESHTPTMFASGDCFDWVTVNTNAKSAQNGGSSVTNFAAITTTSYKLTVRGRGQYVAVRAAYSAALSTDPVVQVVGFDANEKPQRLQDASGSFEVTLADAATDVTSDGTTYYTDEKVFDVRGCRDIIVAIKTAAASANAVTIEARVI